jgi:dienelactone hydrolase
VIDSSVRLPSVLPVVYNVSIKRRISMSHARSRLVGSPSRALRTSLASAAIVIGCVGTTPAAQEGGEVPAALRDLALRRGEVSREAFARAKGVLRGWWAHRDPVTGLLPRRLDQPIWAPQDNAADMFPFLILTSRLCDPEMVEGVSGILRTEIALTTRLGPLPDWYSIDERRFLQAEPEIRRIIFGAAEYAKDGLIPVTELLGPGPWLDRMRDLVAAIFEHAPVASDFGPLPADDGEVCGDLLQVLGRLHFLTGDARYLEWDLRIADAWLREAIPGSGGLPPSRWDFAAHKTIDDRLSLNDHGNEIIGGLTEAYIAARARRPAKAAEYEPVLRKMFDLVIEKALNPDGLPVSLLRTTTGEVLRSATPDTWGYSLSAMCAFGMATGDAKYLDAARSALGKLDQEKYVKWNGADSFADSIEGSILLLNRFPEREAEIVSWLGKVLPRFYAYQKPDGVLEGWYGDGNTARTALMVALYSTRGARVDPWREDLRLGGAEEDGGGRGSKVLHLVLAAEKPWKGRLLLDRPRHRDILQVPLDYPRLNSFPEWFTVESMRLYDVKAGASPARRLLGSELIDGIPVSVDDPKAPLEVLVSPVGPPPYGAEREPAKRASLDEIRAEDPEVVGIDWLSGEEEYEGEPYAWCGRGAVEIAFKGVAPDAGPCALWLRWGSKRDARTGIVEVPGGRRQRVSRGGYSGFAWVRVPLPDARGPVSAIISADPSRLPGAFVSAARLRRWSRAASPDAAAESHLVEVEDLEGSWRVQTNIPGYSGKGFRTSNAGGVSRDVPKGTIRLARGGKFAVWSRGYIGDDQDRRFSVAVGGKAFPSTHPGNAPAGFLWELAGIADLPAGDAAVEVRDEGVGFEVADAVLVTSDLRFDPGLAERLAEPPVDGAAESDRLVARVIRETSDAADASHAKILEAMGSKDAWNAERERLRTKLGAALGIDPLMPRTPLAAKVLGETEREGYRIQRVILESRPNFPVTVNIYIPADRSLADAKGRLPAVLCPLGHWGLSKAEPVVQARCAFLARRGFLVLAYDPFGQGERAVPGNEHGQAWRAVPSGLINMSFMVWDTIRGLDYLFERGDADPGRIGCTGASGGGLNTLYAAAMDERIKVPVPVVYLTSFRAFLETRIDHCPCSHVPGLAGFADMGDVLALFAPRPTLLVAARADDMFTVPGARAAREEALPAYRMLGDDGLLRLDEFEGPHDYNRLMREAMVGWMEKHLLGKGDGSPVPEPPFTPEPPDSPALRCFPEGKVPAEAATVASISIAEARRLAAALPADPTPSWRKDLEALIGWEGPPAVQSLEAVDPLAPGLPEGLVLRVEGAAVPGLRWSRVRAPATVIFISQEGAGAAAASHLFRALRDGPFEVIALDLPGWGSTSGAEHLLHTDALLLGKPMIARRARALSAAVHAIRQGRAAADAARAAVEGAIPASPGEGAREAQGSAGTVLVAAEGPAAGLAALFAAALTPDPAPIAILGMPGSIADIVEKGPSPETGVFGILRTADIPQISKLAGTVLRMGDDGDPAAIAGWLAEISGSKGF